MRTLQVRLLGIMAISFCNVIALVLPTAADPGGKAGWSVHIDPRKRAFLIYVPVADGSPLAGSKAYRLETRPNPIAPRLDSDQRGSIALISMTIGA